MPFVVLRLRRFSLYKCKCDVVKNRGKSDCWIERELQWPKEVFESATVALPEEYQRFDWPSNDPSDKSLRLELVNDVL